MCPYFYRKAISQRKMVNMEISSPLRRRAFFIAIPYWIPVSLLWKDIDQIKDEENLSFVSCHSRLAFTVICLRLKKFCFPSETQMFCKLTNFYVSSPSHTKLFSKTGEKY